jgi:hypothetical protein
MKKKGLSLIVGAAFLIVIVFTMALIINFWGKNFIIELGPAGQLCRDVNFEAGIFSDELEVTNNGNVKLYGFIVKFSKDGTTSLVSKEKLEFALEGGYSESITLSPDSPLNPGTYLVVPIVLEEDVKNEVEFTCPDEFGVEVEI